MLSLLDKGTGEVHAERDRARLGEGDRGAVVGRHWPVDAPHGRRYLYRVLGRDFVKHEWVDHYKHEYVRGNVTTNHVEGYFSQLQRSIDGTHHHVSGKHLPRYLAEFDYRHSTRKLSDTQRTHMLVGQVTERRLAYRPLKNG